MAKLQTLCMERVDLNILGKCWALLQAETGLAPVVVLEATGHDHRALVSYLDRSGYTYYMVNPLQSNKPKGHSYAKSKRMPWMPGIWLRCTTVAT